MDAIKTITSNDANATSQIPVITDLLNTINNSNKSGMVNNVDVQNVKSRLQYWKNGVTSSGQLLISKDDAEVLKSDIQNAKTVLQKYGVDVAKANVIKWVLIGAAGVAVLGILAWYLKK